MRPRALHCRAGAAVHGGNGLQLGALGLMQRAFGEFAHIGFQLALGLGDIARDRAMGDEMQERILLADFGSEALVARGLPRLTLEAVDLRVELFHHVFKAIEIVLRAFQAQFGLVAA